MDTKGHLLYDFTDMKCPEEGNPYRRLIAGCQGLEEEGRVEWLPNGHCASFEGAENVLQADSGDGCRAL